MNRTIRSTHSLAQSKLYSPLEIILNAGRDAILVSLDEEIAIFINQQFLDDNLTRKT